MKILVINAGSSSLKYQFIDGDKESVIAKGLVEKIGLSDSVLTHKANGKTFEFNKPLQNHTEAFEFVFEKLQDSVCGVIKDLNEIDAIGHRVLHGGEIYKKPTLISDDDIVELKKLIPLGPLHMPANISGIEACKALMPKTPNVAIFDTAFHSTMPSCAYLYATPYEWYEKFGIRKYGFHGTSHQFIAQEVAKIEGRDDLKIINCHIGNGASVCAIKNGECIDTSMGLTPLEGLIMGTRSGDVDASVVSFMARKLNTTADEIVDKYLNKKSGLLGISGISSDSRDIEKAIKEGNEKAKLANEMYCYRIRKYIGSYAAALGGADVIVFTAGVGENGAEFREKVMKGIEFIGTIDKDKNDNFVRGEVNLISTPNSKAKIYVIPTNEELLIARETKKLLDK